MSPNHESWGEAFWEYVFDEPSEIPSQRRGFRRPRTYSSGDDSSSDESCRSFPGEKDEKLRYIDKLLAYQLKETEYTEFRNPPNERGAPVANDGRKPESREVPTCLYGNVVDEVIPSFDDRPMTKFSTADYLGYDTNTEADNPSGNQTSPQTTAAIDNSKAAEQEHSPKNQRKCSSGKVDHTSDTFQNLLNKQDKEDGSNNPEKTALGSTSPGHEIKFDRAVKDDLNDLQSSNGRKGKLTGNLAKNSFFGRWKHVFSGTNRRGSHILSCKEIGAEVLRKKYSRTKKYVSLKKLSFRKCRLSVGKDGGLFTPVNGMDGDRPPVSHFLTTQPTKERQAGTACDVAFETYSLMECPREGSTNTAKKKLATNSESSGWPFDEGRDPYCMEYTVDSDICENREEQGSSFAQKLIGSRESYAKFDERQKATTRLVGAGSKDRTKDSNMRLPSAMLLIHIHDQHVHTVEAKPQPFLE